MSYFTFSEEQINESVKKVRDHRGSRNPHFGHIMTKDVRKRISNSLKETNRFKEYLIKRGMENPLTEERIMEIVRETCAEYLEKHAKSVENNNKKINITL